MTLRRLVPVFVATAVLALVGSAVWRSCLRMFDTTVYPVTAVSQITGASSLAFPPDSLVIDGRHCKAGGVGPSGGWAVVHVPAAHLQEFLKQPRLGKSEETSSPGEILSTFGWGLTLPSDATQERYRAQLAGVRHVAAAGGGDLMAGGVVEVVVDLDRPTAPVAYISWAAN